ncbi:MAG: peptidoglycan DD-metalloendopeptidase family protein [Elusimicrobiota bacterium]|nr:peptidoglycan DD-metalloendopeptidase family protein [Elusimicrobiota bacterium]
MVTIILSVSATAATLDSKIKKIEKDINRGNSEFSDITKEINKLSLQIDRLSKEKQTAAIKIDLIATNIRKLTLKINKLNATYRTRRDKLNTLIAELKLTNSLGRKSRLFAEENAAVIQKLCVSDFGSEALFMRDFEEGSKTRIKSFLLGDLIIKVNAFAAGCSEKQKKLALKKTSVEKKIEDLESALGEFTGKIASNKKLRSSYKKSLHKIRAKQKGLREKLKEKERSRKAIDALLETFMKKKKDLLVEKKKERELAALRGTMPWPVKGTLISPFGKQKHPLLDTYIINRGIKIEASTGCVKSVRGGAVSFAGYFKGYGKTVIIEHGGGFYTVTSGFDKIDVKKDAHVKTSSKIGDVLPGQTVYFEIRRNSVPENPELWLRKNK